MRKVFPSKTKSKTDDELKQYLKNPEGLAEFVYGGKMKNDNPGDGFKYRGRGSIQLTGKQNYEYYGKLLNVNLVENPDLVLNPEINAKIVALYTKRTLGKKVNEFKTQEDANRAVTQAIGGPKLNLDKGIGAELLQKVNKASLDYSSEKLQNLSTENADMKKEAANQPGPTISPIVNQNNITNRQRNITISSPPIEELNPRMRR
jgi:predicted chitinase